MQVRRVHCISVSDRFCFPPISMYRFSAAVGSAETRFFAKKWFTPPRNRHRCSAASATTYLRCVYKAALGGFTYYIHMRIAIVIVMYVLLYYVVVVVPTITICVVVIVDVVVARRRLFSRQAPLHDRGNTTITTIWFADAVWKVSTNIIIYRHTTVHAYHSIILAASYII